MFEVQPAIRFGGTAAMSYLAEGEPVKHLITGDIGRVRQIRSNGRLLVRWQGGSESLEKLDDLGLAPGYQRYGRRRNLKQE